MSDKPHGSIDCVQVMRQAREQLNDEIRGETFEERIRALRSRPLVDPLLRHLQERATQVSSEVTKGRRNG